MSTGTPSTGNPATYISNHSAEVILSDIRPIKLKLEALRCINILLDEFLYNVLYAASTVEILDKSGKPSSVQAHPLTTDQLRAGLLHILPTTLGKEALLEAEVELRAYWDRAGTPPPTSSPAIDGGKSFHLLWTYELLKLKCEAYSTLNESDEDPEAESRLNERMGDAGGLAPPKASLVAPAALYLTAVVESMCEHILSKVGRVAARDSSRNTATVHDLFVALCEDDTVYSMFKTMKVYKQIENLTNQAPKRNKSFTSSAVSRSLSHHHESPSNETSSRGRVSSDSALNNANGTSSTTAAAAAPSRTSFDKARSKMFSNSRTSIDREHGETHGHKKSDSVLSEETKKTLAAYNASGGSPESQYEDGSLLQEFDALMRSEDTMKVSLTPDRLKTMESLKSKATPSRRSLPHDNRQPDFGPPAAGRAVRPSLRQVDSIVEDDDEDTFSPSDRPPPLPTHARSRQTSLASVTSSQLAATRTRSPSTSSSATTAAPRKASFSSILPDTMHAPQQRMPKNMGMPMGMDQGGSGFPQRTRVVQRNRESLDLDDIMGGDEEEEEAVSTPVTKTKTNGGGPRTGPKGEPYVSPGTRELIDFLSSGPPEDPSPPQASASTLSLEGKQKSSNRLQRMMSKLNIGSERERTVSRGANGAGGEDKSRRTPPSASTPSTPTIMAKKPIPPRYHPVSPPTTPIAAVPAEEPVAQIPSVPATPVSTVTRSRQGSIARRAAPAWNPDAPSPTPDARTQPPRKISAPTLRAAPPAVERPSVPNGSSATREPSIASTATRTLANGSPRPPPPPAPSSSGWMNDDDDSPITTPAPSVRSGVSKTLPKATRSPPPAATLPTPATSGIKPSVAAAVAPPSVAEVAAPTAPAAPVYQSPPSSYLSANDGKDMRRLLASATTADECRLIVDIFFARFRTAPAVVGDEAVVAEKEKVAPVAPIVTSGTNGKEGERDFSNPYPSPSISDNIHHSQSLSDIHRATSAAELEHSLVELMLGGPSSLTPTVAAAAAPVVSTPSSPSTTPRKRRTRKPVPTLNGNGAAAAAAAAVPTSPTEEYVNGSGSAMADGHEEQTLSPLQPRVSLRAQAVSVE